MTVLTIFGGAFQLVDLGSGRVPSIPVVVVREVLVIPRLDVVVVKPERTEIHRWRSLGFSACHDEGKDDARNQKTRPCLTPGWQNESENSHFRFLLLMWKNSTTNLRTRQRSEAFL